VEIYLNHIIFFTIRTRTRPKTAPSQLTQNQHPTQYQQQTFNSSNQQTTAAKPRKTSSTGTLYKQNRFRFMRRRRGYTVLPVRPRYFSSHFSQ
jgi:hypothetical protein